MKPEKAFILVTSFFEGLVVLIIEIAGARALAPYYGSSLQVWTAQITATLLFLALGYGVGGVLSRTRNEKYLSYAFYLAGFWLVLFPYWRNLILGSIPVNFGVGPGAFLASTLLLGVPLLCLGAVTPLLVTRLDKLETGAGFAAGRLFLINTIGGLVGGWLTSLVLIPNFPLRVSLPWTGIFLIVIASFWLFRLRKHKILPLGLLAAAVYGGFCIPAPAEEFTLLNMPATIFLRQQTNAGLVQVVNLNPAGLILLVNGIIQGGMRADTQTSLYPFSEYLNVGSYRYHPEAKTALVLGMGAGMLAKELYARGVKTTVVELEPIIEKISRDYFGVPAAIKVILGDARPFLGRTQEHYDLIFLDVFSGESVPWYLMTQEAFLEMKKILNPGGRVLINTIVNPHKMSGLDRIETTLLSVFRDTIVFQEQEKLANVLLIAGDNLRPIDQPYPGVLPEDMRPGIEKMLKQSRPARRNHPLLTDDHSDLDFVESDVRQALRKQVQAYMSPEFLSD